jgi:pimeloyl-ACP methyl ester carboxylesterase
VQSTPANRRDSVQAVRFVTVERNVKLEVLDWGGTGRPLVMLAGLGNTAHVFEELAVRLRGSHHVYGITRRGFGQSSAPDWGYDADRLGDDVLAVMDSLHIDKPVLVGHSIAGEELSSIGSRHPERVAGLVYLDAADSYAFYDSTQTGYAVDLADLRRKLDTLRTTSDPRRLIDELLERDLPAFERDLRELKAMQPIEGMIPPGQGLFPRRDNFAVFHDWLRVATGFAVPIAELRQQYEEGAGGSVGRRFRSPEDAQYYAQLILGGLQKYRSVSVPMLAMFAEPHDRGSFTSPAAKANAERQDSIMVETQIAAIRRAVPSAKFVRIPHANHYLFITNEAEVVREMNAFLQSLPAASRQ